MRSLGKIAVIEGLKVVELQTVLVFAFLSLDMLWVFAEALDCSKFLRIHTLLLLLLRNFLECCTILGDLEALLSHSTFPSSPSVKEAVITGTNHS